MERFFRVTLCVAVLAVVAACASPARMNAMIPERSADTLISENSPLAEAITIAKVDGGSETNPLWMSEVGNPEFRAALESSLANHAMLAKGPGKYRLDVTLSKLDQPFIGIDMTVTASVRYRLLDQTTNAPVYEELITQPYTASFGDAFLGVERLRLANEGAIRVNIATFLKELVARQNKLGALGTKISIARVDIRIAGGAR